MVTNKHHAADKRPEIIEGRFTPEEIDAARKDIKRAFEICGLADENGHPVCPTCGKTGQNRVKFYKDGGWHCFSSDSCHGPKSGAVTLVMERRAVDFRDATALLLGRQASLRGKASKSLPPPVVVKTEADEFKAVVDSSVYDRLGELGSQKAAVSYYGRFGIDAEAVLESGAFVVEDFTQMRSVLLSEFGRDRLIACGLLVASDSERGDTWMISERYCVAEPHRHVRGQTLGLQFRMSLEHEKRYKSHRLYVEQKRNAELRGETFREPRWDEKYVPKFMSLKGGSGSDHLVGMGLPRIGEVDPGGIIYVVEGFKDMLAMRTLGFESYALPGAGTAPPTEPARLLSRHNLALSFDADEGGDKGGESLSRALARHGIVADDVTTLPEDCHPWAEAMLEYRQSRELRCYRKRPPNGMDVADVLAAHLREKKKAGCTCRACTGPKS
jgi:hypothetical protein